MMADKPDVIIHNGKSYISVLDHENETDELYAQLAKYKSALETVKKIAWPLMDIYEREICGASIKQALNDEQSGGDDE